MQNDVRNGIKNTSNLDSTADISHTLGKAPKRILIFLKNHLPSPSFENDIPIYIPAISDSSIGLNMLPLLFDDQPMPFNVINDVAESSSILWKSPKSGALELGGGVPKNFFQQTGPALYQILKLKEGGHDYIIQLTDARPDTGGLSGATLQEGKELG